MCLRTYVVRDFYSPKTSAIVKNTDDYFSDFTFRELFLEGNSLNKQENTIHENLQ